MKIAKWIIRYQDFCIRAAINNAPEGYSVTTLKCYFNHGIKYIKTGYKNPAGGKMLYENIQKLLQQHIQPLTPNEADKKRFSKSDYTKKENIPPVAKLACVTNPLTAKVQYGIRLDDTIKIFESEEAAT